MSKRKDIIIFRHASKALNPWDVAIKDAEQMIADAKKQIATLRDAIRGFETLRDGGHPWPGSSQKCARSGRHAPALPPESSLPQLKNE